MKLRELSPFVRWAEVYHYCTLRRPSVTADCRFLYILSGAGTVTLEEKTHEVAPDTVFFFQGGTPYRLNPRPSFSAVVIDFDLTREYSAETEILLPIPVGDADGETIHRRIAVEDAPVLNTPAVLRDRRSLRETLSTIVEELTLRPPLYREKASALFQSVLIELARSEETQSPRSAMVDAVRSYIAEHYAEKISNGTVAEMFKYDPCYLNRIFREETGVTIHRYLLRYRIERAIRLFLTTEESVEQIAEKTGFCNIAHLSAACRQITGHSPRFFRRG